MLQNAKITFAVCLLVLGLLSTVKADIYQYTDANGVIHFTNVDGGRKHQKKVTSERAPSRQGHAPASSSARVSSSNFPSTYVDEINRACDRHGVDPVLVHAIIKVESDFNPYALSNKGAMGLMQLMPQTAMNMNVRNTFNPTENIDGGVKYLRYLIDRYEGNLSLALAAYNCGETAVKKWGTIPPFKETQQYVDRILRIYNNGGIINSRGYASRYTIYMGYGEDGSLILTDNPSNHPIKKFKARKNL